MNQISRQETEQYKSTVTVWFLIPNCHIFLGATDSCVIVGGKLTSYVENTEFSPEMVSSLMKTKNVLELSWDMWIDDGFLEDGEDSIKKVAELLQKGKI